MTRQEYVETLSKKQLKSVVNAFCDDAEPLGTDANIRFVDYSDDPDCPEIGFMHTHTGEMVDQP